MVLILGPLALTRPVKATYLIVSVFCLQCFRARPYKRGGTRPRAGTGKFKKNLLPCSLTLLLTPFLEDQNFFFHSEAFFGFLKGVFPGSILDNQVSVIFCPLRQYTFILDIYT